MSTRFSNCYCPQYIHAPQQLIRGHAKVAAEAAEAAEPAEPAEAAEAAEPAEPAEAAEAAEPAEPAEAAEAAEAASLGLTLGAIDQGRSWTLVVDENGRDVGC